MDLTGNIALVTGAAGGIGLEFAKVLARMGASLILLDISEERLIQAKSEISGNPISGKILTLKCDLTSLTFIDEIEEFCSKNSILPDILINNAGIFSFRPIADTATKK